MPTPNQEGTFIQTGNQNAAAGLTLCVSEDGEEVCETYVASLNSNSLIYSSTNEATGCFTTYIFTRTEESGDQ